MDNWHIYYSLFKNKWLDKSYFDGRRVAALEYYAFLSKPTDSFLNLLEHLDYKTSANKPYSWNAEVVARVVKDFDVRLQQDEAQVLERVAENARRYEEEGGTRLLENIETVPLWEGFYG